MKSRTFLLAALCSSTSVANAIELTDFTDPNTAFDEAYIDFNANANAGNQDQTSYSALLSGFYNMRNSTEKTVLNLGVDASLNASRDATRGPDDSRDDYGFSVDVSRDAYFSEENDKLFYFVGGQFAHQDSAIDDDIDVSLGIGYGRVWNSTPLARALRVQEELREQGYMNADMSDDAILALGAIIGKEDEYRAQAGLEDYRGAWYADMEQVILGSGVLVGESLSALATVALDQVLMNEPISPRRHGWLVRAGAGIQLSDFLGVSDNDPKLKFQLEYAKPYGLKGQLIEVATYEPVFGNDTVHQFTNDLSYSYELTDRIDWVNAWQLKVIDSDAAGSTSLTTNLLTSSFLYKLSNQLNLNLALSAYDNDVDDDVSTAANLSLRYRLK